MCTPKHRHREARGNRVTCGLGRARRQGPDYAARVVKIVARSSAPEATARDRGKLRAFAGDSAQLSAEAKHGARLALPRRKRPHSPNRTTPSMASTLANERRSGRFASGAAAPVRIQHYSGVTGSTSTARSRLRESVRVHADDVSTERMSGENHGPRHVSRRISSCRSSVMSAATNGPEGGAPARGPVGRS